MSPGETGVETAGATSSSALFERLPGEEQHEIEPSRVVIRNGGPIGDCGSGQLDEFHSLSSGIRAGEIVVGAMTLFLKPDECASNVLQFSREAGCPPKGCGEIAADHASRRRKHGSVSKRAAQDQSMWSESWRTAEHLPTSSVNQKVEESVICA